MKGSARPDNARTSPRRGEIMKSYVFALAALAAVGWSGAAFAGEATKTGPANTGPAAMTDAELDPGGLPSVGRCTANLAGAACFSDIRLKRDIIQVARLDNGLGLYRRGPVATGSSMGLRLGEVHRERTMPRELVRLPKMLEPSAIETSPLASTLKEPECVTGHRVELKV
jgi:hypothetical protein